MSYLTILRRVYVCTIMSNAVFIYVQCPITKTTWFPPRHPQGSLIFIFIFDQPDGLKLWFYYKKLSLLQKVYKTVMTVVFCQIRNYEKFQEKKSEKCGKSYEKMLKTFVAAISVRVWPCIPVPNTCSWCLCIVCNVHL